jgi:urease subunit alpha
MKRARGSGGDPAHPAGADNERVLRHLAKVTINPAITHGLAHDVGALTPGRIADCVVWRPELFGVRPELVVKMGMSVWGASGDPDATTMLCEPVVVRRQIGAHGGAPARLSLAFLSAAGADADLPITRRRSTVQGCRTIGAADMVRNDVRAEVDVTPDGREVRVDGERIGIEPVAEVALSWRYLLG